MSKKKARKLHDCYENVTKNCKNCYKKSELTVFQFKDLKRGVHCMISEVCCHKH